MKAIKVLSALDAATDPIPKTPQGQAKKKSAIEMEGERKILWRLKLSPHSHTAAFSALV